MAKRRANRTSPSRPYEALFQMVVGKWISQAVGTVVEIGGEHLDSPGYDLLGLICGSEGQLGVVTEAVVRILRSAEGARPALFGFERVEDAGACVAAIIAAGIIPVALEYMDKPAIQICEAFAHAGYPLDVEAMLIVADKDETFLLTGAGDVVDPEHDVIAVGSGGNYALAAARALYDYVDDAETIARRAMDIAASRNATTAGGVTAGTVIGTARKGSGTSKTAAAEAAKPATSRLTSGTSLSGLTYINEQTSPDSEE